MPVARKPERMVADFLGNASRRGALADHPPRIRLAELGEVRPKVRTCRSKAGGLSGRVAPHFSLGPGIQRQETTQSHERSSR